MKEQDASKPKKGLQYDAFQSSSLVKLLETLTEEKVPKSNIVQIFVKDDKYVAIFCR